jgi:hypothetical protein
MSRTTRRFTPGNTSNSSKMIKYVAEINARNPNVLPLNCVCIPEQYNKFIVASDSVTNRLPNKMRISQIIQTNLGGSTQYGNFYLGQPLELNYLGNAPGMPGGSGMPPKNKF